MAWYDMDDDGIPDKLNDKGEARRLHLSFYVYEEPDNDVRVEVANMIADQLATAGIELGITTVTLTEMTERLSAGSYYRPRWPTPWTYARIPGFMLMRGNTGNYCRYRSDTMTELVRSPCARRPPRRAIRTCCIRFSSSLPTTVPSSACTTARGRY